MLSKKNKKDKLEGAISNELSSDSIMSSFVGQVQNDKTGEEPKSRNEEDNKTGKDASELAASRKEKKGIEKSIFGSGLPMIRQSNKKEWWISLGAFLTVILLISVLFIGPCETGPDYEIRLASAPIDAANITSAEDTTTFSTGTPIYFYFVSDDALDTPRIHIVVESTEAADEDNRISSVESKINPKWKRIETHFQKEFFETPGKYRVFVQNAESKTLAEKIFYIR